MTETLLLRPAFLAPVTVVVGYVVYMTWQTIIWPSNLPNLPVVGSKPSDWFPLLQARWRNSTNYRAVAEEINTLYKHRPCLVPVGGSETIVLLPASETQHIVDQPDAVLDMPQPMIQGLQFKYTVKNQIILHEPLHQKIVTSDLTHQISNLIPDMLEEVVWGFEKQWGASDTTSSEFKDVPVFDTMRRIVGSVSNRVFVGLPTGRDPKLVDAGTSYAAALPQEAGKIRMYPSWIKPFVAPFYTKRTKTHTQEFYDILVPEIEKRLKEHEVLESKKNAEDTTKRNNNKNKNDFLEWSIPQAKSHPDPRMLDPETLACRVLMLNFGAIHTTSFTMTHAIFDLFSSSPEHVEELRTEIANVLARHGGEWSKKAMQQMEKLDSLVRESLRLNMASTFGVPRLVIGKGGFVTSSGVHVPRGNIVAVPGKNIAREEDFYPEADTYKPFRFSDMRGGAGQDVEYVKRARQAAATTSPEFLPFGHGRHACPGRFFAVAQLKLILGYMMMNYEVEMLEERPADIYIGVAKLPPLASKIRIRRRQSTASE